MKRQSRTLRHRHKSARWIFDCSRHAATQGDCAANERLIALIQPTGVDIYLARGDEDDLTLMTSLIRGS